MKFHASEAASLIALDYANDPHLDTVAGLPGTARVVLYRDVLVGICQGTQSWADWLGNIRFLPRRMRVDMMAYFADEETAKGERLRWHRGFLQEAVEIWNWAHTVGVTPDVWIGHSLGGATGQIEAFSYGKPGIFFASPRALAPYQPIPEPANVLQIYNVEDLVSKLPRMFNRIGVLKGHKLETDWRPKARHSIHAFADHIGTGRVPDYAVEV